MTYNESDKKAQKYWLKINFLLLSHLAIFLTVVLFSIKTLFWGLIIFAGIGFLFMIVERSGKKVRASNKKKKMAMLAEFGDKEIKARARVSTGGLLMNHLYIIFGAIAYTVMIGTVALDLYSQILIQPMVVWSLVAAHSVLMTILCGMLIFKPLYDVHFIDNYMLLSNFVVVDRDSIVKTQYFERNNGSYFMEMNSPERFDRIILSKEAYEQLNKKAQTA